MKLAIVVQRYGMDVSGGAELHARYVAELLSPHMDVRVLTTCARDHLTWKNELAPGADVVNGVPVERFPVSRERRLDEFGIQSRRVFTRMHTLQEELDWLESEGPVCPSLVARLRRSRDEFDVVVVFTVRYYHAYHGVRAVAGRAVLVPTAERDPALGLAIFQPIFRGVRAIMYNSFEERAAIHAVAGNESVPGVVVGVGSAVPDAPQPGRARQRFGLHGPYLVYVGRIDANKGCAELFECFLRYLESSRRRLDLVLIGVPAMPVPEHPSIRHLGAVGDEDKFDVVAGAEALVMPSRYESLSMAAIEAWGLGRPVVANAHCDVLLGQCLRSNAGLWYDGPGEFEAVVERLLRQPDLAGALGRNGRRFFERHYTWPVIGRKYLGMFERLRAEPPGPPLDPLPGWFGRRRPNIPPALDVVGALPSGPVRDIEMEATA